MPPCHPEDSRYFSCVCGNVNVWLHDASTQACLECRRLHTRGKDGPPKEPDNCQGVGKVMKIAEAVWRAHEEFVRTMYLCGYEHHRHGTLTFINVNPPDAERRELTLKLTEHFIERRQKMPSEDDEPLIDHDLPVNVRITCPFCEGVTFIAEGGRGECCRCGYPLSPED